MKNSKFKIQNLTFFLLATLILANTAIAQETPPSPSAPKSVNVPAVKEKKLSNDLTVAVVERKNVPLVTIQLLVKSGAQEEDSEKAGLANMTATLLTKGTKTRTATQIAEQMEFLGGSINTGAGWNNSIVTIDVMSDKLEQAMAILSDVVLNPTFKQEEIDLLKSQTLDGLAYNLKQPGFLANYVASAYSFSEHPAGGTPQSINGISRQDIAAFHKENFVPDNAVLIFAGDITAAKANALAQKYFGKWKNQAANNEKTVIAIGDGIMITESKESADERRREETRQPILKRILVVDLPDSGQAAVTFAKDNRMSGRINWDDKKNIGETAKGYYPALVFNSILGGGYSSRLNQEIRIKRGLSYGAGSSFAWRWYSTNFSTRAQTKNESAAEVAELVIDEVKKLTENSVSGTELTPRKSVLTGNFGQTIETTGGLAGAVADLYSFELPTSELNSYMKSVQSVSDAQIRDFAKQNLLGGDIIIVGDYAKFKDDLSRRFPKMKIVIVKADNLDLKAFQEN
jgi:zinc protease